MSRIEVIKIPWMGPSLNSVWAGRHWSFRKKVANDAHLIVALRTKGIEPFNCPVNIEFRPFVKGRKFDTSNYSLTYKALEDGLVIAKVLKNDNFNSVKKVTLCPPQKTTKLSYCELIITECD